MWSKLNLMIHNFAKQWREILFEFNNIHKSFHIFGQMDKTMVYASTAPLET